MKKTNIVLIGMPCAGKTTIGRMLSERTGMPHVDTDAEIVKNAGMPIPEIFRDYGEKTFRDMEILSGDRLVRKMIGGIHRAGKTVIASSHEFKCTPSKDEMIRRMQKMQDMGADILKIAVMPQTKADVLTLLCATEEMARCHAERPLITMSMSPSGVISRICGEAFGSAMTFGAVGQTSAPGQIPVEHLNAVLEILHAAG